MKILIAGGGIGGLTAALCLAQSGHKVEVFEQAEQFSDLGAGIQLSPNCTRVLHQLGLEPELKKHGFLPEGTEIRDWKSGKLISESRLGQFAVDKYQYPYYHIHRGDLVKLLFEASKLEDNIQLNVNAEIKSFEQSHNRVQLHVNNTVHSGDLLVGADGIHSAVRSALWGEEQAQFTGNVAWRALVHTADIPKGLIPPVASVWWGPNKHFVHYFLRGGELINCVCVVEKQNWQIESWTEPGEHQELKSAFTGWHQDIQLLLDHCNKDTLYKWALYDRQPMESWSKGRVTLLGDACHPTLPFMAQGAAMAIEDSAVLASCLNQSPIEDALKQYETLRKDRTASIQRGSRRNATVFHLSGIKAWARNLAAGRASNAMMDNLYGYNVLDAAQLTRES